MRCDLQHAFKKSSLLLFVLIVGSCNEKAKISTQQEVATTWADMTLYVTKNTPANSPTFASRGFGYIGLTMYESIVHGYPTYESLAGQLNGLTALPIPDRNVKYDWVLSLNAGQAYILKKIYIQTSDANKQGIDSLENLIYSQFSETSEDDAVASRSVEYGKAVAEAIFQWSLSDGGHRGYLKNFDKSIVAPTAPGSWEPPLYGQSFSHFPLHPHWGDNRTFVKVNSELPTPTMITYDTSKKSEYYNQFLKVYKKNTSVTQEEKETALWWADDPGETFTPPGHSYYLGTLVLRKQNPELIKCAETYARIGMATADAFINCWKWKYHFWSERPSSFVNKNIDERWESFWPDPPFPAFPSGHATQAAATATVLIDLFGEKLTLIDSAHALRPRDELRKVDFKPRMFTSFWQVAEETANSRFYGGIHSPQDNDVGLAEGSKVGRNINALNWNNNKRNGTSEK
ncbi:MAG: vanadium-dependent haloperoxidase [Chryseolinea sp.]